MSGAGNRYVVVPTVTVLAVIKNRLGGAKKGHQLLKKKADALNMRFRQILRRILETKEKMGVSLRESNFALTEAKYTAGDSVKHTIVDSVKVSSRVFPITQHSARPLRTFWDPNHRAAVRVCGGE